MNEHIRSRSLISDTTIRTVIQPGSLHDAWEAEGLQGGILAADNEQRRWDSLHIILCKLPVVWIRDLDNEKGKHQESSYVEAFDMWIWRRLKNQLDGTNNI